MRGVIVKVVKKGLGSQASRGSQVTYPPLYSRELIPNNFSGCEMYPITHRKELLATYYNITNARYHSKIGKGVVMVSCVTVGSQVT